MLPEGERASSQHRSLSCSPWGTAGGGARAMSLSHPHRTREPSSPEGRRLPQLAHGGPGSGKEDVSYDGVPELLASLFPQTRCTMEK